MIKLKLLKNKNFTLLLLAGGISKLGNGMLNIALSLYILKITGSAGKFAFLIVLSMIPMLLLSPIGGVLADRFDKRKMLVLLDFLSGCVIACLAFLFYKNSKLTINQLYIGEIISSTIAALYNPVVQASLPSIVKKEDFLDANSINSIVFNTIMLVSPLVGASIFGFLGLYIILVIDAISFYLASISELFIEIPIIQKDTKLNTNVFISDFKEGLSFIKSKKILTTIMFLGLFANAIEDPIEVIGFNYICKIDLKVSDYKIGLLNSVIAISALVAPFLCKIVSKKLKLSKILFLDIFIVSVLIMILAIVPSTKYKNLFQSSLVPYISILIIGFTMNLICSIGNLALSTILQSEIPLDLMGRVQSVIGTVVFLALPIGQIIFGFLFDNLASSICILLSGVSLFIFINIIKKSLLSCED